MSDVQISIGGDVAPFMRAIDKVKGATVSLAKSASSLGGAIVGGGLIAGINQIIQKGDQIGDVSQRFGVSAEMLQRLGVAAEFTGTSIEAVARGMKKMQQEGMAADAIYDLADAVASATTENEAFAIAEAKVGARFASDLLPMLKLGGEEMRRLGESAHIMSEETIAALSSANDEIFKFKQEFTSIAGFLVGKVFQPAINGVKIFWALWGSAFYGIAETSKDAFSIVADVVSGNLSGAKDKLKSFGTDVKNTLIESLTSAGQSIDEILAKQKKKQQEQKPQGATPEDQKALEDAKKAQEEAMKDELDMNIELAEQIRQNQMDEMTRKERIIALQKEYNNLVAAAGKLSGIGNASALLEAEKVKGQLRKEERDKAKDLASIEEKRQKLFKDYSDERKDLAKKASEQTFGAGTSSLARIGGGGNVGTQNTEKEQLAKMKEQSDTLKDIREELQTLNQEASAI